MTVASMPDVVAGRAIHATGGRRQTRKMLPPPTTMPSCTPQAVDLRDLLGDERTELGVDAVLPVAQEGFTGQLEQDPLVTQGLGGRSRPGGGFGHSSSPSA